MVMVVFDHGIFLTHTILFVTRVNHEKATTWNAKCPIFLGKKIGHLAFQA